MASDPRQLLQEYFDGYCGRDLLGEPILRRRCCESTYLALRKVLELHKHDPAEEGFCEEDELTWPCPTVRAIAEALKGDSDA